jgi:hypothetical protein
VGIIVAANPSSYLADFEHVRVFGMFGAGDLKRVPEDVICIQEGVGSNDDAIAERLLTSP